MWSCGRDQGYLLTTACLSFFFLSWKSLFSHRNVLRSTEKTGKWVNLQLLFNVAILNFIMSCIYISHLPESCILSCLLLLYSIFNLWITYFETITWESVTKWCMCLGAHTWIHICVHITRTILCKDHENHRYSKKCCNFVQQDGKKKIPQCELCKWLLNHCSILALAEAMFSSVSVITVFRRRAESGTNLTDHSLFLSNIFTGMSIQRYTEPAQPHFLSE